LAALVVGALMPVVASAPPAPAASDEELQAIGTLDRIPADAIRLFGERIIPPRFYETGAFGRSDVGKQGTLLSVPESRELWQVFEIQDAGYFVGTALAMRDMDTLQIKRSLVLDGVELVRGGLKGGGNEWMATVGGGRVFLATANYAFISVDVRTLALRSYSLPPHLRHAPLAGLSYDPFGDRLLLAASIVGSLASGNAYAMLIGVDLASGDFTPPRTLRSCNGPFPATEYGRYQTAPYATEKSVFIPCQRAGNSGAVVRLDRASALDPSSPEEVVVGPTNMDATLVDTGSGRIFMSTIRGIVWVFDTATMAFVGVIGANDDGAKDEDMGYGVDPVTGRFFFQSPTFGLGIVEGRFFPIPQARSRRDMAADGQERIISDAVTNRLFVIRGIANDKEDAYTIYRTSPAPTPPSPPDPDANTSDQEELAGVTESRYFASAGGYGVRALLANGVSTIVPAPATGEIAPTADTLKNNINAKCGFFDRELVAARVAKTEADTGSTLAESIAVDIDARTRQDLDRPSRCEPYGKNGNQDYLAAIFATAPEPYDNDTDEPRWNRDPATCSTSADDDRVRADGDDHGAPPLGSSQAECPTPGRGDVVASARASLTGPISVGKTRADTRITRAAGRVKATATAIASDIEIGEAIHIAEIRSVATSESRGRPGKGDMSSHEVVIKGLHIAGTEVCGVCDPAQAVGALNFALAGRAQFRLGTEAADRGLMRGSPRGALTAVQKSPTRQVSDRALVGDFTNEVPALEMIFFNDNSKWGRARQIYQFAGVATAATYNIVPLPRMGGDAGDDGSDGIDSDDGDAAAAAAGAEFGGDGVSSDGTTLLDAQDAGSSGEGGGVLRAIGRAIRAVARGLQVFAADPRHGLAILTGWALFGLPALLFRRRFAAVAD
jgi:hypothetical protein